MRPWTSEERDLLRNLHAQQLPNAEIARHLSRSGEAVSNMSRRLGLRRRETAQPWTETQLSTLDRMLETGCSLRQIAESTGHPRSSVADKLRRLNVKSLRFRRPWTGEECQIVTRLHASGAGLAAIAEAVPSRSVDAIQQKLQELIGPAPFRSTHSNRLGNRLAAAVSTKTKAERTAQPRPAAPVVKSAVAAPPSPARAAALLIRERREAQPVIASTDDMIRWLRTRDFMVIHRTPGWQVDRHHLVDEQELLEFVNIRRLRLNLPVFTRYGTAGFAPRPAQPEGAFAATAP